MKRVNNRSKNKTILNKFIIIEIESSKVRFETIAILDELCCVFLLVFFRCIKEGFIQFNIKGKIFAFVNLEEFIQVFFVALAIFVLQHVNKVSEFKAFKGFFKGGEILRGCHPIIIILESYEYSLLKGFFLFGIYCGFE